MTNYIQDYLAYGLLPGVAYLVLLAAAVSIYLEKDFGLNALAGALLLLVIVKHPQTPGTSRSLWSVGTIEMTSDRREPPRAARQRQRSPHDARRDLQLVHRWLRYRRSQLFRPKSQCEGIVISCRTERGNRQWVAGLRPIISEDQASKFSLKVLSTPPIGLHLRRGYD